MLALLFSAGRSSFSCTCVAANYAELVVVRTLLSAVEAVVVPAIEITIGMFFTRNEQSFLQPIFWITCQAAPIVPGFTSYGLLWSTGSILPWKLFMITTSGLTFFLSIWTLFYYPSNHSKARFLILEEKVHVIRRMHNSNQRSIEQKQFKEEQFIETLRDPISCLFTLQAFTLMFSHNLTYGQQNLLTTSLGITSLGSALVAVAGGGFGVTLCIVGAWALTRWPNQLALHDLIWCVPAVAGGIGKVTIAWAEKIGMLACFLLAGHTYGITYIVALGWTRSSAAGYTKKLTRNVMFTLGYSVGNLVSPQIWVPGAAPRYYGTCVSMIVVSWAGTPAILYLIRFILARRNKERKEWAAGLADDNHEGTVEELDEDGQIVRRVGLEMLDLTNLEKTKFICPL